MALDGSELNLQVLRMEPSGDFLGLAPVIIQILDGDFPSKKPFILGSPIFRNPSSGSNFEFAPLAAKLLVALHLQL